MTAGMSTAEVLARILLPYVVFLVPAAVIAFWTWYLADLRFDTGRQGSLLTRWQDRDYLAGSEAAPREGAPFPAAADDLERVGHLRGDVSVDHPEGASLRRFWVRDEGDESRLVGDGFVRAV